MNNTKALAGDNLSISAPKFDLIHSSESSCEYTMPDYYAPIRKIVSCTAHALPDAKFISGSILEFGGTLAFNILYIGEDGSLGCVPHAIEYSGTQTLSAEVRGTAEIAIDAVCEDIQCRVLAPRKISLRARVKSRISACEKAFCRLQMLGSGGDSVSHSERALIQTLSATIPVMTGGRGLTTGKASGEFREKQGSKPVSAEATISITEAKCRRDAIFVKGEACIKSMVFTPEGYYSTARARFPFEEVITAEGAMEGDICRAWGRGASVTVTEGENSTLSGEVEYDLEAEWCRKGEISLVTDAYATGRGSRTEQMPLCSHSLLCCFSGSLSVNGNGKRTTRPEANEYLIDMSCTPSIEKAEQRDAHIIFSGSSKIKAYIASNGEVICEEMTLPFKYEAAAESMHSDGKIILYPNVTCTDISGRLEGDTFFANAELCLSIMAKRETEIAPLSLIALEEMQEESASQIKVFYGAKGETLWDIAKKHKASISKTEEANSLSRRDAVSGTPVIIPIGI